MKLCDIMEFREYKKLIEEMDELQREDCRITHTSILSEKWAEPFRKIHHMIHNIDFEKKFRIIVDYDPEGAMVARIYYPTLSDAQEVLSEAQVQKF